MIDRCVICGEYIVEGRQICEMCEMTNLTMMLKNEQKRKNRQTEGLIRAIEIIDDEIKFARYVNTMMCAGMVQIKKLIEEEIDRVMAE